MADRKELYIGASLLKRSLLFLLTILCAADYSLSTCPALHSGTFVTNIGIVNHVTQRPSIAINLQNQHDEPSDKIETVLRHMCVKSNISVLFLHFFCLVNFFKPKMRFCLIFI